MKFLKISNIKIKPEDNETKAFELAKKAASLSDNNVISYKILKLSIDARDKSNLQKIYTIGIWVKDYSKKERMLLFVTANRLILSNTAVTLL